MVMAGRQEAPPFWEYLLYQDPRHQAGLSRYHHLQAALYLLSIPLIVITYRNRLPTMTVLKTRQPGQ